MCVEDLCQVVASDSRLTVSFDYYYKYWVTVCVCRSKAVQDGQGFCHQ